MGKLIVVPQETDQSWYRPGSHVGTSAGLLGTEDVGGLDVQFLEISVANKVCHVLVTKYCLKYVGQLTLFVLICRLHPLMFLSSIYMIKQMCIDYDYSRLLTAL